MATPLHVVALPWPAFGHMIPFLQLSLALAKSGVRVSYVSTPRNIERLPCIPPTLAELLTYEELALPKIKDLPEDAEATIDITFEKIQYLKVAYDLLEQPFSRFVSNRSLDWIITDFAASWTVNVANNHGVPLMFFSVFTTAFLCFIEPKKVRLSPESLTIKPWWVPFESSVALRAYEAPGFYAGAYEGNASGITDVERLGKVLEGSNAVAIRSCQEFEGEYLDLLASLIKKPVLSAGLLPPPNEAHLGEFENLDEPWSEVFEWLDEQISKTVVFVGFGSECKLTKEQIHEIGYGLELSKLPFLWAIRDPLPEGFEFENRTFAKGRVCYGWAPQRRILAHPSVGGCLFHSGWGSVIESLQHGHCLVVLPFIIDQGLNARLLVDKELALEVERKEDGSFSKEDISRALRRAMVEDEGERLRECARNAAKVFGDSKLHQERYIGGLVDYMRTNAIRKPSI